MSEGHVYWGENHMLWLPNVLFDPRMVSTCFTPDVLCESDECTRPPAFKEIAQRACLVAKRGGIDRTVSTEHVVSGAGSHT